MPRKYEVFIRDGETWRHLGQADAANPDKAVEEHASGEGIYAAVPSAQWVELPVKKVARFSVVRDEE